VRAGPPVRLDHSGRHADVRELIEEIDLLKFPYGVRHNVDPTPNSRMAEEDVIDVHLIEAGACNERARLIPPIPPPMTAISIHFSPSRKNPSEPRQRIEHPTPARLAQLRTAAAQRHLRTSGSLSGNSDWPRSTTRHELAVRDQRRGTSRLNQGVDASKTARS
jgi:hypothetical protein